MNKLIQEFLKSGVEALPNSTYGEGYRCSAYLSDGTYLPCVMLRKNDLVAALAIRRFEQEKHGKGIFKSANGYTEIVKNFVASGNRVNYYDLSKIEFSRYAIPVSLLKQIEGETSMGWTGFVFEMKDGKLLSYGTTFGMEFFDMPSGYEFGDVVKVRNHSYVCPNGELKSLKHGMPKPEIDYDRKTVLRERPYFICYHDA